MSWGVTVRGNVDTIRAAFEAEERHKAQAGAPAGEIENINDVCELAMITADFIGEDLQVSASGNWICRIPETENLKPVWQLGELSVRITRA